MHQFTPESPPTPYRTVSLSELFEALRWKRFRGKQIKAPKRHKAVVEPGKPARWVSKVKLKYVHRAEAQCKAQLLSDLRSDTLTASVLQKETGMFWRIPPSFWTERYAGLHLSGTIFDYGLDGKVIPELLGAPIYIFDERAVFWLATHDVKVGSAGYPRILRQGGASEPRELPSNEVILAKLLELCEAGMRRDEAVKRIRQLPGFQNVQNSFARELLSGHLKRGRRPKK